MLSVELRRTNGYLISFIVPADGGAEPSTTNYIWENGNLVGLSIASHDIDSIPSSLSILTSLRSLDLSYSSYRYLPSDIGNLVSLHTLFLRENQIVEIPKADIKSRFQLRLNYRRDFCRNHYY